METTNGPIKVSGSMTLKMVKLNNSTQMEHISKEIQFEESNKDTDNTTSLTNSAIRETSSITNSKAKASTQTTRRKALIKETIIKICTTAKEVTQDQIIRMMDSGPKALKKEKELKLQELLRNMKGSLKMM